MISTFDRLTDKEIEKIGRLVQTLDQSGFDFLKLELGDIKLTIGKGDAPSDLGAAVTAPVASPPKSAALPASHTAPASAAPAAPEPAPSRSKNADLQGTVAVLATTMGRFYARPEPSAPPFVTVGADVEEDATVGLIEVMKLFNSVQAGVGGVIAEICVEDAQFVEHGQVLMRIKPAKEEKSSHDDRARPDRQPGRDRGTHHTRLPGLGHRHGARRLRSRP